MVILYGHHWFIAWVDHIICRIPNHEVGISIVKQDVCPTVVFIGQPRPPFVYFYSFQVKIFTENCRLQQDSNSYRLSIRRHADHLTTTIQQWFFPLLSKWVFSVHQHHVHMVVLPTTCKQNVLDILFCLPWLVDFGVGPSPIGQFVFCSAALVWISSKGFWPSVVWARGQIKLPLESIL